MKSIIVKTDHLLSDSETSFKELEKLVGELKRAMEFGIALKVLDRMGELEPDNIWVHQQNALCTYKNEDEHISIRLHKALKILEGLGIRGPKPEDPETLETFPETLGLAGAVYKRLWEYRGRIEDIYSSMAFYRRGWECDPKIDMGYCGVNVAYILDVLANRIMKAATGAAFTDNEAQSLARQSMEFRKEMKQKIISIIDAKKQSDPQYKNNYWHMVTLAEICAGLEEYIEAEKYFVEAAKVSEEYTWERQTTVKQYIDIVKMKGIPLPQPGSDHRDWHAAWKPLYSFLEEYALGAIYARPKVGLALSGGGFRASLFHLGVLACLAEMDVLKSVEVISTVSGGSIVGAHYYLELRLLLETKRDEEITKDDYIALVRRVQDNFFTAVKKNLRTRAVGGLWPNIKMLFLPGYTRSIRLAELYQHYIYNQVPPCGPLGCKPSAIREMIIVPLGEGPRDEFSLSRANWRRRSKAPILLINSTSLNSGHNFQFTARYMGEPPSLTGIEVDMNARYRRMYYEDLSGEPELYNFPLGGAVAASACVPGLFEPIELRGLYPGKCVRLVDGGVHDNQGVAGLLDESCRIILCSDASGQMGDLAMPAAGRLGVLMRSDSILQDRLREAQYQEIASRVEDGSLDGFFFVHLKKDLDLDPVDWVECNDPTPVTKRPTATSYNIDRDLQRSLSNIRTDLDSFSEVEAYALMLSGYEMTRYQFKELAKNDLSNADGGQGAKNEWQGFDVDAEGVEWTFLKLKDLMFKPHDSSDESRKELGRQLAVGAERMFKIWRLSPTLRTLSICLALSAEIAAIWWLAQNWNHQFPIGSYTPWQMILAIGVPLAALAVPALAWVTPQRKIKSILLSIGLVICGWLLSWLHLAIFDRMYLRRGRLERLLRLK